MRFKKKREEEITIGIAPLIDIVFLLLIFFMVTSHFDIVSGVRIQLPKVTKKILNEEYNKEELRFLEIKEVRDKYDGICKAFQSRHFSLNSFAKLKAVEAENVLL